MYRRCSLPAVEIPKPRCSPHPDGETRPIPYNFTTLTTMQCAAASGAISKCVSGLTGDYTAAVECCVGLEKFSDGGCVCSTCDATCSAVVDKAKPLCAGYRIKNKASCPIPDFANKTMECKWRHSNFLTTYAKYQAETDPSKKQAEGLSMCTQGFAIDSNMCQCLNPNVTGINSAGLNYTLANCAKAGNLAYSGLQKCAAAPALAPAPAPAPAPGGSSAATCTPLYADYGTKCAAARRREERPITSRKRCLLCRRSLRHQQLLVCAARYHE